MTNQEATQLKIKCLEEILAGLEQKRDSIDNAMLEYDDMDCEELCALEDKYLRLDDKIEDLKLEITKYKKLTII
jgi:hypothetical protein